MVADNIKVVDGEKGFTASKMNLVSKKTAESLIKQKTSSYIDCIKSLIIRMSEFGKTSCEWTLPVKHNEEALEAARDYFKERGFTVGSVKFIPFSRYFIPISWEEDS